MNRRIADLDAGAPQVNRTFQCTACRKRFRTRADRQKHQTVVHGLYCVWWPGRKGRHA